MPENGSALGPEAEAQPDRSQVPRTCRRADGRPGGETGERNEPWPGAADSCCSTSGDVKGAAVRNRRREFDNSAVDARRKEVHARPSVIASQRFADRAVKAASRADRRAKQRGAPLARREREPHNRVRRPVRSRCRNVGRASRDKRCDRLRNQRRFEPHFTRGDQSHSGCDLGTDKRGVSNP